jgi:Tat protein translocase TatB subunit
MFNLGLSEMILIGVIALIFIGPKQLPEIARTVGRMLNELRRATEDITTSITDPKSYARKKAFEDEQARFLKKSPEQKVTSEPEQEAKLTTISSAPVETLETTGSIKANSEDTPS